MTELKRDKLSWHDGDMPFSETFGDHFYSRADGRSESRHVFVDGNRIPERWQTASDFTIGELGFGTGLNFLETWRLWRASRSPDQVLRFVTFEGFPMPAADIRRAISAWPELATLSEQLAGKWPTLGPEGQSWRMDEQTTLEVIVGDAPGGVRGWTGEADAWYLDGFAPARNPEMWSAELMKSVAQKTAPDGTFATYTAAGWVRRNLEAAGFSVEKRPGHAGKREMMLGTKCV